MNEEKTFKYTHAVIAWPFLFLFIMWFVYWLEVRFDVNFNHYGIYPQNMKGLRGVLFSPFLHGDIKHLFNNSIPIFVLFASLLYFYEEVSLRVFVIGFFLTGILTWAIGRPSYHIGASGVVYFLFSFIFFSGVFRKYYRLMALSMGVIFLYGSLVWYVFPIETKISWEGHLSGFIVGLILAYYYRKEGPQKLEVEFQQTEFDTWFDEDGNFNPPQPEEEVDQEI